MKVEINMDITGFELLSELNNKIQFQSMEEIDYNKYCLIQRICLLSLDNEDNIEKHISSFKPNEETIDIIQKIVLEEENIEIKARAYDILQINLNDRYKNCMKAYEFYTTLADKGDLNDSREFLIRSIEVLKALGQGGKEKCFELFERVKGRIFESEKGEFWFTKNILIKKLFYLSLASRANNNFDEFISLLHNHIDVYLERKNYEAIRSSYDTLKVIDKTKSKNYHYKIGKSFESEADEILQKPNTVIFLACNAYKKAISFIVDSELGVKEIEPLKQKLSSSQKKSVSQMVNINQSIPPNDKIISILDNVEFDNFEQAIYWLINLIDFPKKDDLVKRLENSKESLFYTSYCSSTLVNKEGSTVGKSDDNTKLIYEYAKWFRNVSISTIIMPAFKKINNQFVISYEKVFNLLNGSDFIPKERIGLFAYAVYQGFIGNFIVSTHLLLPQIENALRFILLKEGIIPTKLTEEIQEEILLSRIIGRNEEDGKLKGILSNDVIFDLQGLLNEPFGDNLRNEVAHGLCDMNKLSSTSSIYLWWLSLKLGLMVNVYLKETVE